MDIATTDASQEADIKDLMHLADPSRYVTLPTQHEKIWKKYQDTLNRFWTAHEVNLGCKENIAKLSEDKRQYILKTLTFMFVAHNTIVNKELFMQLINLIDIKEVSYYLGSQADTKKTHGVMYFLLLDDMIGDEREKLISEVVRYPDVRAALKWYLENLNCEEQSLQRRLLTFASLQGILFEASFLVFSWFQKNQPDVILPGLFESNIRMWSDERANTEFTCMLFDYLEEELDHDEALAVIQESVFHARRLFMEAIPVSLIGMDCELIDQYIRHSADKVLTYLRVPKHYKVDIKFDWVLEPELSSKKEAPAVADATAKNPGEANFMLDEEF